MASASLSPRARSKTAQEYVKKRNKAEEAKSRVKGKWGDEACEHFLGVKEFKDSQGIWEAIWALCKEYPDNVQEALHRVINETFQRLSVRKAGISHKAIFKAVDWSKAKKGKKEARDDLVWGEAIVEDEELCQSY